MCLMVSHRYCFLGFVLFLRFKNDDILSPDQIKGGMILHFKRVISKGLLDKLFPNFGVYRHYLEGQ